MAPWMTAGAVIALRSSRILPSCAAAREQIGRAAPATVVFSPFST
jgi:hypothetical protein